MKVDISAKTIGQVVSGDHVEINGSVMNLYAACDEHPAGGEPPPPPPQPRPALLQNRYRILGELGCGGFGKTFLAQDTGLPSGRRCVVKQLKFSSEDERVRQAIHDKFYTEAKVLEEVAELSDQIPKLYAYFVEDGEFYLVQEWIDGETLTARVRRAGVLVEGEARRLLTNLIHVLDYLHSRRIIHRDIKPDNVLLRRSDSRPVLIDFGAVKEVVKTAPGADTSIVIGTPGFMSPEQAGGKAVYASDIYSLGWTVFYLLTAKLPSPAAVGGDAGEAFRDAKLSCLTPNFAAILRRTIRSQLAERYSNTKDVLRDLEGLETFPSLDSTIIIR